MDEKELKELEKKLAALQATLDKEKKSLSAQKAALTRRENEIAAREEALAEADDAPQAEAKEFTAAEKKLIEAAAKAYGIAPEHVAGCNIRDGKAVICTAGGAKVTYAKGDKVEELTAIQITGVNPRPKKRKPLTG